MQPLIATVSIYYNLWKTTIFFFVMVCEIRLVGLQQQHISGKLASYRQSHQPNGSGTVFDPYSSVLCV